MRLEEAATLLREFNYKKNGKTKTIQFLVLILNELVNGEA